MHEFVLILKKGDVIDESFLSTRKVHEANDTYFLGCYLGDSCDYGAMSEEIPKDYFNGGMTALEAVSFDGGVSSD